MGLILYLREAKGLLLGIGLLTVLSVCTALYVMVDQEMLNHDVDAMHSKCTKLEYRDVYINYYYINETVSNNQTFIYDITQDDQADDVVLISNSSLGKDLTNNKIARYRKDYVYEFLLSDEDYNDHAEGLVYTFMVYSYMGGASYQNTLFFNCPSDTLFQHTQASGLFMQLVITLVPLVWTYLASYMFSYWWYGYSMLSVALPSSVLPKYNGWKSASFITVEVALLLFSAVEYFNAYEESTEGYQYDSTSKSIAFFNSHGDMLTVEGDDDLRLIKSQRGPSAWLFFALMALLTCLFLVAFAHSWVRLEELRKTLALAPYINSRFFTLNFHVELKYQQFHAPQSLQLLHTFLHADRNKDLLDSTTSDTQQHVDETSQYVARIARRLYPFYSMINKKLLCGEQRGLRLVQHGWIIAACAMSYAHTLYFLVRYIQDVFVLEAFYDSLSYVYIFWCLVVGFRYVMTVRKITDKANKNDPHRIAAVKTLEDALLHPVIRWIMNINDVWHHVIAIQYLVPAIEQYNSGVPTWSLFPLLLAYFLGLIPLLIIVYSFFAVCITGRTNKDGTLNEAAVVPATISAESQVVEVKEEEVQHNHDIGHNIEATADQKDSQDDNIS